MCFIFWNIFQTPNHRFAKRPWIPRHLVHAAAQKKSKNPHRKVHLATRSHFNRSTQLNAAKRVKQQWTCLVLGRCANSNPIDAHARTNATIQSGDSEKQARVRRQVYQRTSFFIRLQLFGFAHSLLLLPIPPLRLTRNPAKLAVITGRFGGRSINKNLSF